MNYTKLLGTFPTIQTKNIILRKLQLDDALKLFNYYSYENVHRHLDWNGPGTLERS